MNLYGNEYFFALLFVMLFALQLILLKVKPVSETSYKSNTNTVVEMLFSLCIALAVATLFHLFPGSGRAPIQDSSVFLYIGRGLINGKAPYRDMFDHKGPLLYLIQYLGLLIGPDGFSGVWFLEVFNLACTSMIMFKLANLVSDRKSSQYLGILAALVVCGWKIWQGGNYTEEYALPWISLAAYIFFSFFITGTYTRKQIIMLGASFAVVLLLRANMIAIWLSFIPIVLFRFFAEKRYSDLRNCLLLFVSGMALVILPVIAWSWNNGFLAEMWEDYILFNITYSNSATKSILDSARLMAEFTRVVWPGLLALVLSLCRKTRRKETWYNLVFYVVSLMSASMSGRLYYHYAIVLLPAMIIPFCCLFDYTAAMVKANADRAENPILIVLSSLVVLAAAVSYRMVTSPDQKADPVLSYITDHSTEANDVLILGNSSWYYLLSERKTENRFFYQLPPLEISMDLRAEFQKELTEHPSDLIVVPGEAEERAWILAQLGGLNDFLQNQSYEYVHEYYDQFEVYIKNN